MTSLERKERDGMYAVLRFIGRVLREDDPDLDESEKLDYIETALDSLTPTEVH